VYNIHNMSGNNNSQNLSWTIVANTLLTATEFVVGTWTGSLSLISDATHNLADIITLIISYIADQLSRNKATNTHSYGYKRVGILASLLNCVILLGIAIYIFISAFYRFNNPEPIEASWVIYVSILAIFVNGFSAFMVSKNQKDLNIRVAYINMLFDALASVGVLFAGVVIYLTKWYWIDGIISAMIGFLLLKVCYEIFTEAIDILLEAVPKSIPSQDVRQDILDYEFVKNVVDLHIWAITGEKTMMSAVIEISQNQINNIDECIEKIKARIKAKYNIDHQTIEVRIKAIPHED
jgi:cobalt-zinc-cadmium efflux system protein